jgi:hypothetical protein
MNHDASEKRDHRVAGWIVLAFLVLYPLSIDPLAFVAGTGLISDPALATIQPAYAPLLLVGDFARPVQNTLLQYYRQSYLLGLRLRH